MHFLRLLGTGISRMHISATSVQPRSRAASAGKSASRSSVMLKIALATSSFCRSFFSINNSSSSLVAVRISSLSFCSTVVAPRIPLQYIVPRPFQCIIAAPLYYIPYTNRLVNNADNPLVLRMADRGKPCPYDPSITEIFVYPAYGVILVAQPLTFSSLLVTI